MKNSMLFRQFICTVIALLVAGGATAEGVRLSEWRDNAPVRDFSAGQSLSQAVVTNNQEMGLFQRGFVGGVVVALLNPAVLAVVVGGAVAVAVSGDDDEAVATTAPARRPRDPMCSDDAARRVFTEPTETFAFLNFPGDVQAPIALVSSIVNWRALSGASSWTINISDDVGVYSSVSSDGLPLRGSTILAKGVTIFLSDTPVTSPVRRLTLYTYDDSAGVLFAAAGSILEADKRCAVDASEFFLTADNVRTTVYADSNQFREGLRGVLNEGTAVHLGDFYFAGDEKFSNIKLERRDDLWLSEEFDVYSALGYQKIADDNTAVFYNQLTALRRLSADTDGYLQISSGSVTSDKYRDGQLRGLAVGFIADKVLSHDNILHFRLERPTGDARAKSWYAAADVQMGNAAKYWSFSLRHNLDTAQIEGGIYYQREF